MAFADHYPLSSFVAVVELRGDDRRKEFQDHRDSVFGAALLAHLIEMRDGGFLGATGGLKGRDAWLPQAWNDFVAGSTADAWLPSAIGDMLIISAVVGLNYGRIIGSRAKAEDLSPEARVEATWASLCAMLDAGTTDDLDWRVRDITDGKTGDRCELHFAGWKATLMRRTANHSLEVAPDVAPIPLTAAEFDVPSGRLLLSDSIRVEGFREGTDFPPERDYQDLSLNSDKGQAARTLAHAAEHNLGYAQTTNTCVVVHRHPVSGRIMVSQRWNPNERGEDADGDACAPGWEKVGTFSCDVWRVTAIDQQVACDRIRAGGNDNAEKDLTSYLASGDCYAKNIVHLDVPAGRWRIRSGPDFSKRVNRKQFDIPKGIRPWLILEPAAA